MPRLRRLEQLCRTALGAKKKKKGATASPRRGVRALPVTEAAALPAARLGTGIEGLDRVLGGGLVPGSLLLLAGEPGIGKSTLLLQVAASMAKTHGTVVYVTGEESAEQVALRARRIDGLSPNLLLLPETSCDAVLAQIEELQPSLVVVDSVQTAVLDDVDAVAGSVSQVRQVASRFQHLAKTRGIPVVLVGHVTKDGMIAGPKLLEHLVDVVMSLEGEPGHDLRALRAGKNRFGTVAELALYSMTGGGLEPVQNASAWLLEDRQTGASGSAVAVALEGTVPLLVEVQALVSDFEPGDAAPRRPGSRFVPTGPSAGGARTPRRHRVSATVMSLSTWWEVCRCANRPSIWRWRPRSSPPPPTGPWPVTWRFSARSDFSGRCAR